MPSDDLVYLGHMLEAAGKVKNKTQAVTRKQFNEDENLRLATVYLLQTIGEASRRISKNYRYAHPEIPWSDMIGMRNKLVHDYTDVDEDIVWDTVSKELQPLIDMLEKVLRPG